VSEGAVLIEETDWEKQKKKEGGKDEKVGIRCTRSNGLG